MSRPGVFDPRDFDDWLVQVAVRVDEWIARPLVRDRFLAMLRAWRAEHDGHGKHGDGLLPVRAMTQPEKYAALAAIHDRVCEGAEQLDLWDCRRGHGDVQKMKAGMAYVYLQDCVNVLSTEDQARVEGVVSDIEADLAKVTAESAQTPIGELVEFCRSVGKRLNKIGFGPDLSDIDRYHAARDVMDEALDVICRANAAYSNRPDSALVYEKVQRVREALSELTKITAEPYDEAERNTEAAKTNRWMRAADELHKAWQELDSLRSVPCDGRDQTGVTQSVSNAAISVGPVTIVVPPAGVPEQQSTGTGKPRGRVKREAAYPRITEYLKRRPLDTAEQVADEVGCSVGMVAGSPAWRANQQLLKRARRECTEPRAVRLDERAINEAGGCPATQLHAHREESAARDDDIDRQERELFERIGEYREANPDATPPEVARAIGCSAGDVERRDAMLQQLTKEQADSAKEEIDVEDPTARRGKRREWVDRGV